MSGPVTPGASRLLLLASLFPGLAHAVTGRRRVAVVFAAPVALLLAAGALIALSTPSTVVAARLFDPDVLTALLVVQGIVLAWRLVALIDVARFARLSARPATLAAGALALVIVVGPQAYAGYLTSIAHDAAVEVFEPVDQGEPWVPPDATPPPVTAEDRDFAWLPSSTIDPEPAVSPTPAAVARVNILLIGVDSGIGRNTALTDTMIVASLDPVGKTVSMVSIPRDLVDVPLPDGRLFKPKINGLAAYVRWNPGKFPGAKNGQSVLAAAIGRLLDIRITHWAQVDLGGFVSLVNSIGGIDITVDKGFCDPTYDEYGIDGFGIRPGRYHMNGGQALAFARVRKAAGENDFTRAARQQDVAAAIRDKVVRGGLLNDPAGFLRSIGRTVKTNVKPALIAEYIETATSVDRKDVFRAVIRHPLVTSGSDARGSILIPDRPAIRQLAERLFTPTGTRPKGFDSLPASAAGATKNASSSASCGVQPTPRPTPRPTPKPTVKPSASPSADPSAEATPTPPPEPTPTPTPEPVPTPTPTPDPGGGGG